jgi:hypothetical protein
MNVMAFQANLSVSSYSALGLSNVTKSLFSPLFCSTRAGQPLKPFKKYHPNKFVVCVGLITVDAVCRGIFMKGPVGKILEVDDF